MTTTPPPPPNPDGAGRNGSSAWSPQGGQDPVGPRGQSTPPQDDAFVGEARQPQWNASSTNPDGSPRQDAYPNASGDPYANQGQHGGGHYAPPHGGYAPSGASDSDRLVAVFCHLSGIISTVLSGGWLPFVGPLVIWFLYKDKDPFVRRAAAGSFNFHVVAAIVFIALWIITILTLGLALPLTLLLFVVAGALYLWWTISASMKASRGEPYTYPVEIKILD